MKGLILKTGEKGYSYFKKVFLEVDEISEKYNWLITYPECFFETREFQKKINKKYIWMSGLEVKNMLCLEDAQWIWGVFSGFSQNVLLKDILKYELPYADGYTGFWQNPVTLQHPLSEVEFVAWDSSCTLFISKEEAIIEKILAIYPHAEDLESYNKR